MAIRQYIGARYVVKVYENSLDPNSAEWENVAFEPLTMVTFQNSTYLSRKQVPANVGNPATATAYWAITGYYNGQIAALQTAVGALNTMIGDLDNLPTTDKDSIVDAIIELSSAIGNLTNLDTTYQNDLVGAINEIDSGYKAADVALFKATKSGKHVIANLVLNDIYNYSTGGAPNGSCYVDGGYLVVYYTLSGQTNGTLVCYNLNTYTEQWRYTLPCNHGNSVTYNPNNGKLYISGAIDSGNNYINEIYVVDFTSPTTIERTITLPAASYNYSLTYDRANDVFYAINAIGATPNQSNLLYVYNSALDTVLRTQVLEDFPAIAWGASGQGIQLAIDGVAYAAVYSPQPYIIGWDVSNGKVAAIFTLPELISDFRKMGELQSLPYDFEHDRFLCMSVTTSWDLTLRDYWSMNIFEIDAFKGIDWFTFKPLSAAEQQSSVLYMNVSNGAASLKPIHLINNSYAHCLADVINYSRKHPVHWVNLQSLTAAPQRTAEAYHPKFDGCNLRINNFTLYECDSVLCKMAFFFCTFTGAIEFSSGYFCNARFTSDSVVYIQQCIFNDINETGTKYHLAYMWGGILTDADGHTWNGSGFTDNIYKFMTTVNGVFSNP